MNKYMLAGIELKALDSPDVGEFLTHIDKNDEGRSVLKGLSTVSLIPSLRDKEKKDQYVQGMEKFINTLRGKSYRLISARYIGRSASGIRRAFSASSTVHPVLSIRF